MPGSTVVGRRSALWRACLLAGLVACSERAPTGLPASEPALAKGSGGGGRNGGGPSPVVDATDPSSAPQDVRLNVRVLGSNYDNGSTVRFLLDGKGVTTVAVHSTQFVSATELVVDVSITADAEVDLYDVEVTNFGGKKGIGIEKFAVTGPTAVFPAGSAGAPDGLYGDGMGFYVGGFVTNSQQTGSSSGNFNVRPLCEEGRSWDVRLPWTLSGFVPDCDASGNFVNFHVPALMFANSDCGASGCPIGGAPVPDGAYAPTVNHYVTVDVNRDGRYETRKDKAYNVVWTNATYVVLSRASDGSPCSWRVQGTMADLYSSTSGFVPEQVGGSVALDVTVSRFDGPCGS